MTARPQPTHVLHFTHIDHLPTVIERGLVSDSVAQAKGVLTVEVGDIGIKRRRRERMVPAPPGGAVADYVPFYFAPRSPMMYSIAHGGVETYDLGTARIIYLVTTLERLDELGREVLLTDRNAVYAYADFRAFDPADLVDDNFIDWDLMRATYWNNTAADPQRKERRMAEALVHQAVPWEAFAHIATQNEIVADEVRAALAVARVTLPVFVRPAWYF